MITLNVIEKDINSLFINKVFELDKSIELSKYSEEHEGLIDTIILNYDIDNKVCHISGVTEIDSFEYPIASIMFAQEDAISTSIDYKILKQVIYNKIEIIDNWENVEVDEKYYE